MKRSVLASLLFLSIGVIGQEEDNSAITLNEFRDEVSDAQEKIDHSKTLLNHNRLHELIKRRRNVNLDIQSSQVVATTNKETTEETGEGSVSNSNSNLNGGELSRNGTLQGNVDDGSKVGNVDGDRSAKQTPAPLSDDEIRRRNAANKARRLRTAERAEPSYYVDPSLNGVAQTVNQMVDHRPNNANQITFGITIGSQFKIRLINGASSTQGGDLVFEVVESTMGYKDVLPAYSKLFGKAQAVIGDSRLYAQITRGITPEHKEFRLTGSIVGYDNKPGLIAVVRNDGRSLQRATTATVFSAVENVVGNVAGNSLIANAGIEGANLLINEKHKDRNVEDGSPAYVVEAAVQDAFLSVNETF